MDFAGLRVRKLASYKTPHKKEKPLDRRKSGKISNCTFYNRKPFFPLKADKLISTKLPVGYLCIKCCH